MFKRREQTGVYVHEDSLKPPHYRLVFPKPDAGNPERLVAWEPGAGRNNIFRALVLFLWFVREKQAGAIDSYSDYVLGADGFNMLRLLAF